MVRFVPFPVIFSKCFPEETKKNRGGLLLLRKKKIYLQQTLSPLRDFTNKKEREYYE